MNVVFVSPGFPPNYVNFSRALSRRGIQVLGVGDTPVEDLPHRLLEALTDYYLVQDMADYDAMLRACGYFTHRYGRIDRIESMNEHWLAGDAALREDFNVYGLKPVQTDVYRSKMGMKSVFQAAGIASAEAEHISGAEQIAAFVQRVGFPVIIKPDVGVGAHKTYKIAKESDLKPFLQHPPKGFIIERFIDARIVTFDGLVDANGRILYVSSLEYGEGVMEFLQEQKSVYFRSVRELAPSLRDLGERIVRAFGLRERFFHIELFRTAPDEYLALEVNLRPPGGYILDMMNYSADIDLYDMWAEMLANGSSELPASIERKYFTAHVGRRYRFSYRYSPAEITERLGEMIAFQGEIPAIFSDAMGNYLFILRHPEAEILDEGVQMVLELA